MVPLRLVNFTLLTTSRAVPLLLSASTPVPSLLRPADLSRPYRIAIICVGHRDGDHGEKAQYHQCDEALSHGTISIPSLPVKLSMGTFAPA